LIDEEAQKRELVEASIGCETVRVILKEHNLKPRQEKLCCIGSSMMNTNGKPVRVVDALKLTEEEAARELVRFVDEHHLRTLNVAGPRASHWFRGHAYARDTIAALLARVAAAAP
jgi:hypothetical protein